MSQNSKSADKSSPAKPKLILGVITAALIVLWLLSSLGGGGGMSEIGRAHV